MEPPIDLQDWELLGESDPITNPNLKSLEEQQPVDHDSDDGAIKSDYFSLDPIKPQEEEQQQSEDEVDSGGVDSDNPSWLDPDSDSRNQSRGQLELSVTNTRSFWSDESSPRSVVEESEEPAVVERREEAVIERREERVEGESLGGLGKGNGASVWWKMPLEILKVWVLRARPVWSISIAAAIVGVVMLGRKLYKMKQRGRSIPLRIAIDDKKASQFMARAARLNEAFSVVRRAPVIRPSLPASGITSWPVASLR